MVATEAAGKVPQATPLDTLPLAPEIRAGRAKADSAAPTVLSSLTATAHSTPSAPFYNPEAPSLLTLAEQPRGDITGQLQKAGGAGPTVLSYLAGSALPTALTLKLPLLSVESNSLCSTVLAQCFEPLPSGTIP